MPWPRFSPKYLLIDPPGCRTPRRLGGSAIAGAPTCVGIDSSHFKTLRGLQNSPRRLTAFLENLARVKKGKLGGLSSPRSHSEPHDLLEFTANSLWFSSAQGNQREKGKTAHLPFHRRMAAYHLSLQRSHICAEFLKRYYRR